MSFPQAPGFGLSRSRGLMQRGPMLDVLEHMVFSSREQRVRASEVQRRGLQKVATGAYLSPEAARGPAKPWEIRRTVAAARLLAVDRLLQSGAPAMFTGEAAMVALGLEPWWNNPDIEFRSAVRSRGSPALPAVLLRGKRVSAAAARQNESVQLGVGPENPSTGLVRIAPLAVVATDIARRSHPLQGVHDCSLLLRRASAFDRFDLPASRARAERVRSRWLAAFVGEDRTRGSRRACAVLRAADPAVESPAESIVGWCLRLILRDPASLASQFEVVSPQRFFLDFAVPEAGIAIEVTGFGKFGETHEQGRAVGERLLRRQQVLSDLGFSVLNVTYKEAQNPHTLIRDLTRRLSAVGVPVQAPRGPLWDPSMTKIFSRDRRY